MSDVASSYPNQVKIESIFNAVNFYRFSSTFLEFEAVEISDAWTIQIPKSATDFSTTISFLFVSVCEPRYFYSAYLTSVIRRNFTFDFRRTNFFFHTNIKGNIGPYSLIFLNLIFIILQKIFTYHNA